MHERAARLIFGIKSRHGSRWQAVMSITAKISCAPQTLNNWAKKALVWMPPVCKENRELSRM